MEVLVRTQPDLGQDHDPGYWIVAHRAIGPDWDPIAAGEGFQRGRDEADLEQGLFRFSPNQRLPEISSSLEDVHHAVECGARGLRYGHDEDFNGGRP
jgi:hypothetical protein